MWVTCIHGPYDACLKSLLGKELTFLRICRIVSKYRDHIIHSLVLSIKKDLLNVLLGNVKTTVSSSKLLTVW